MNLLRNRLETKSPELYAALMRNWEIAQREWLSSIGGSSGSYNSLPHFMNIESQLNSIVNSLNSDSLHEGGVLSILEIYLLLASVLFHDFGRVYGDDNHSYKSANKLTEYWSRLGVPSKTLADSLARIAIYHDPVEKGAKGKVSKRQRESARKNLCELTIEPYGVVREVYVATLLALADHMDGSIQRTVPDYIESDKETGFKGAFRRMVSGTHYDNVTQTIKVSLTPPLIEQTESGLDEIYMSGAFKTEHSDRSCKCGEEDEPCELFKEYFKFPPTERFREALCRKLQLERLQSGFEYPSDYVLAMVLNDVKANNAFLKSIQRDLYEMGLPIESWLVTYQNQSYDHRGRPKFETSLQSALFDRLLVSMWDLSRRVLRSGAFSYETLADHMCEGNSELVRRAAKRFSNWTGGKVICGHSNWYWGGNFSYDDAVEVIKRHTLWAENLEQSQIGNE